jgi:hypothetical protein
VGLRFSALLFAGAALYHLLAVLAPSLGIFGVRWRHLLFVAIDAGFAGLLLRQPRWLVFPLSALTLYSVYSHGTGAWRLWHREGRVDWLSLGVVTVLPAILWLTINHRSSQKPSSS